MPTYATLLEVQSITSKEILIELTDDVKNGQVQDSVVNLAIDLAEGEVNAALSAAGYAVPVVVPLPAGTEIVKTATIWLAICHISARRGVIPEDYKGNCDYFREVLGKIADGDLAIPLPSGSINDPQSTTEGQEKIFSRSKFEKESGTRRNEDEIGTLDVI